MAMKISLSREERKTGFRRVIAYGLRGGNGAAMLAGMLRAHLGGPSPSAVADRLLADTLPTKANLLTGVDGRDEVESPVETQSVYVEIPNPLREVNR
jgi:hypothetical protein